MKRKFCRALVGLLFVSWAAVPVPPTLATNWSGATGSPTGCDSDVNMADNKTHTFRFEFLSTVMQNATTYAMNNSINGTAHPTDLNAIMDSTPDSSTDVWTTDTYYTTLCGHDWCQTNEAPPCAVGLYVCESLSGSKCQQATVRYNNYWTDEEGQTNERGLACHEVGHSLGLLHRDGDGCIHQGYPKSGLFYSDHDRGHLNVEYD